MRNGLRNWLVCAWKCKGVGRIGRNAEESEMRAFYSGIIKEYNHNQRQWWVSFQYGDDDTLIRYDTLIQYVGKEYVNFVNFAQHLLAEFPISSPAQEVTHHNQTFVMADALD